MLLTFAALEERAFIVLQILLSKYLPLINVFYCKLISVCLIAHSKYNLKYFNDSHTDLCTRTPSFSLHRSQGSLLQPISFSLSSCLILMQ